jgi:hypothetical protein
METIYQNKQNIFEKKVCEIFNYKIYSQNEKNRSQMIIDRTLIDEELFLTGTIGIKTKSNGTTDFLLIITRDSEANYIESITLKMLREIVSSWSCTDAKTKKKCKITIATNLPLDVHSFHMNELKKGYNLHHIGLGYLFCENNNLEFTEMY